MRRTKTLKFNMDVQWEKDLYNYLQALPHGEFSNRTKRMWLSEISNQNYLNSISDYLLGKEKRE